jgi:SAM-dependent methyltransferase
MSSLVHSDLSRAAFAGALQRFDTRDAYLQHLQDAESVLVRRHLLDRAIVDELRHGPFWFHCTIGDHPVGFQPEHAQQTLDWREQGVCPSCQLNSRMRFCLELLRLELGDIRKPRLYLTEQATYGYVAANRLFPGTCGSEFVFDPARADALQHYIRHITGDRRQRLCAEDVTALSFADAAFDAIGSFEVLEHVPDYPRALAEFARVLRPGGLLLLTAPFLDRNSETLVRARIAVDGALEHLETPEYHGDPASPDGALCFYHFGWDLLDALRSAGFERVEYVTGWSLSHGLLGTLGAFVARRASRSAR